MTVINKISTIIQYSLLVAGEEDDYKCRDLGPIHLLKYVYLADLFYAKKNNGKTYTGIDWIFYNFGPWSQRVHAQIAPALHRINATQNKFNSDYGKDDWVRWSLQDSELLITKERQLPTSITLWLRKDIHKYLKDLPELLNYVYSTEPMINAAPNESLDFNFAILKPYEKKEDLKLGLDRLSISKKKKFKTNLSLARNKYQESRLERQFDTQRDNKPRYDEVFEAGIGWLESLPGQQFEPADLTVDFSNEVWKSDTRNGGDVS